MKTKVFTLLVLTFVASASIKAQKAIEEAYQRMASDPKVSLTTSIQADSKPGDEKSGKTSLCEIHSFTIEKADKKNRYRGVAYGRMYVEDIKNAIQAEAANAQCYRIATYDAPSPFTPTEQPRAYNLLYGEDASQYVKIGTRRGFSYIFVCLLDPSKPGYRWCYALDWNKTGDAITGRFMKLYAKIPKEPTNNNNASIIARQIPDDGLFDQFFLKNPDVAAKALKFDSDGFFDGIEIDSIDVDGVKGLINLYHGNYKTKSSENFFQRFNALKSLWMKGDYATDDTLPVSVYTLVKEALNADILTPEEKDFVNMQIVDMVDTMSTTSAEGKTAAQYLALTQKMLLRNAAAGNP